VRLSEQPSGPEPPASDAADGREPGGGAGGAAPRRLRAPWPQLAALLGFLTLAVLLLGSTWTSPTDRTLGAGVGDPGVFIWFLRWTPFAVGRHISPFYSDYLNHPDGVNLMWNTWVPLPGLLLSPLTLTFGPVLTLNVLLTLAYGLSSWSAYLAIRRYVPSHLAAAAGGLVYGFSFAMRVHSHHPNLILVFLLPWLLVLVDEILVRQRRPPVWLGVGLGLLCAAQALVGEELLAATVLAGALLTLALALSHPRAALRRAPRALAAFAVALLVAGALLAWPLKAQLTGPARVRGDITAEARGASDLLALVTPHPLLAIDPLAANRLREGFTGSSETYLGVPLLLVVVAVAAARLGSALVRAAFAVLLALLVLSLGAELRIDGHPTGVRLPWAAVEPVPLIKNMVPARLSLLTSLFAGLLLAVALHGLWSLRRWWWRALAVAVAAVVFASLAPAHQFSASPVVATPPFFTTAAVRSLPRDSVALLVPFPRKGRQDVAMVWQAQAGMWFKMPGGYFVGPDPGGGARHDAPPTTTAKALVRAQAGQAPKLTPALRTAIAADFATWRVASVVLGPTPHRQVVAGFLTKLLGRPPEDVGGVQLWRDTTVRMPPGSART
jgi:hypothetical protein